MDSTVVRQNQIRFCGPYLPQNWSLPDSIIHYIAKNPSSSKGYQKLICNCKYFYVKNPVTVCKHLVYDGENDVLQILENQKTKKTLDITNIYCKLTSIVF